MAVVEETGLVEVKGVMGAVGVADVGYFLVPRALATRSSCDDHSELG